MAEEQNTSEDSSGSPLGLASQVEQLLKMPQSLCKQRGICCKVATFKGSLSYEGIKEAANDPDNPAAEMARDFASVFIPYNSQDEVREIADEFVDRVRSVAQGKGQNPDDISFFKCKFVLDDGRCGVHEDRPIGCRVYPFPHKNTIYHPGCGFEQRGKENWDKIESILNSLGISPDDLTGED